MSKNMCSITNNTSFRLELEQYPVRIAPLVFFSHRLLDSGKIKVTQIPQLFFSTHNSTLQTLSHFNLNRPSVLTNGPDPSSHVSNI
jgi:hypothetical protein